MGAVCTVPFAAGGFGKAFRYDIARGMLPGFFPEYLYSELTIKGQNLQKIADAATIDGESNRRQLGAPPWIRCFFFCWYCVFARQAYSKLF